MTRSLLHRPTPFVIPFMSFALAACGDTAPTSEDSIREVDTPVTETETDAAIVTPPAFEPVTVAGPVTPGADLIGTASFSGVDGTYGRIGDRSADEMQTYLPLRSVLEPGGYRVSLDYALPCDDTPCQAVARVRSSEPGTTFRIVSVFFGQPERDSFATGQVGPIEDVALGNGRRLSFDFDVEAGQEGRYRLLVLPVAGRDDSYLPELTGELPIGNVTLTRISED